MAHRPAQFEVYSNKSDPTWVIAVQQNQALPAAGKMPSSAVQSVQKSEGEKTIVIKIIAYM